MRLTGHRLVAETLQQSGVTHVFGISGSPIKETLAACAATGIRVIGTRHQQAAVLMALAHNYRSGRLSAAAIVSAGPAVTNTLTGLLVARDNCWPVLVIGGLSAPGSDATEGRFQRLDGAALAGPLTKWSAEVRSVETIVEHLSRACRLAVSGVPGPVYLELAAVVLRASAAFSPVPRECPAIPPAPDAARIAVAARELLQARRPALFIGKGARWCAPFAELRTLVEAHDIPFITTPMGRGALPDDHPLCGNPARDFVQQQADVVLLVGARLNWTFRFGAQLAKDTRLIHIDIGEAHLAKRQPHDVLITGDAREALCALLSLMKERSPALPPPPDRQRWVSDLHAMNRQCIDRREARARVSTVPMSPQRLMEEIRAFLPREAICVLDGRDAMAAGQEILQSYLPASRFTAGSNGCMGTGVPFGIGAKLAAPEQLVVVVSGDMAFGISAMEMETMVRHRIAVIVVVVNNDGPCAGADARSLYPAGHELSAAYLPRIPYEKMMEAFGGYAESVDRPGDVQPALRRAVQSGLPACLNVHVDPNVPFVNFLG